MCKKWIVSNHCKDFYKGSSTGAILGSLRVKATHQSGFYGEVVDEKLVNLFCLSNKLVLP